MSANKKNDASRRSGSDSRRGEKRSRDETQPSSDSAKKSRRSGAVEDAQSEERHPSDLANYPLSKELISRLKIRGVTALFPIQQAAFHQIHSGMDVLLRAQTGTGKTLAFVLPIVQRLIDEGHRPSPPVRRGDGAVPRVLVLAPTRELAQQIGRDFESVCQPQKDKSGSATDAGRSFGAAVASGGSPMDVQRDRLRAGADIVVGTPGRVQDFIDRGVLKLDNVDMIVLDEADEMLRQAFLEAVEAIFKSLPQMAKSSTARQTVLCSATVPPWLRDLMAKFFVSRQGETTIDLVAKPPAASLFPPAFSPASSAPGAMPSPAGSPTSATPGLSAATAAAMSASGLVGDTHRRVRHLLLRCHATAREGILRDIVELYAQGGRSLIFTETKARAHDLALALDCHPLHGDMPQDKRDSTVTAFREGKVRSVVATNVAARGIDIPQLDLVVQTEPPQDAETYVHRAGRTGRAGRHGTVVTFVTRRDEYRVSLITRNARVVFEEITPPQPEDLDRAAAVSAAQRAYTILRGGSGIYGTFRSMASQLLDKDAQRRKAIEERKDATEDLEGNDDDEWLPVMDREAPTGPVEPQVDALAACLAVISGVAERPRARRSLLSGSSDAVTVLLRNPRMSVWSPRFVVEKLTSACPDIPTHLIANVRIAPQSGGHEGSIVALDVPHANLADLTALSGSRALAFFTVEVPTALPSGISAAPIPPRGGSGGSFHAGSPSTGRGWGDRGGGRFGGYGSGGRFGGRGGRGRN
eukprot:TRINITY_DN14042_c0_g1_i1.p1 TRINITY_DN14042_c0_g1~~TRINITY_DN14042_c0_g1_i1.p1  ORF type:complete len:786 (+),score=48.42 TRINITY_DN14042_c0_g1_i1:99-2360(+)